AQAGNRRCRKLRRPAYRGRPDSLHRIRYRRRHWLASRQAAVRPGFWLVTGIALQVPLSPAGGLEVGALHPERRTAFDLHDERSLTIRVGAQHSRRRGTALLHHLPHDARESLMTRRTGSADLPLHGGRVPQWLGERMAVLGAIITQAIV